MSATRFIAIRAIRRAAILAWTVPAVAALAFLAVACSSGDDATSTPANTPAPTATTAAATAAADPPAETSGTVTIGSVMPSTGDLGVFGPDMIAAVDIVASEVNAAGGLNGKALQILHRDSATNEQVAADAANALVNVDGAVAIIGGMSSGITLSIAQSVAIPNGIVQVSPASSSPAITFLEDNDFVFRTNVSDALQGGIIADVATELGYDRIATTYINNAYGEGLSRVFTEGVESNGGTITGQVGHESGQVSYLAELRQAAQDDAEALIVIAYPETASVLLRESVEGGFFENYIFVDGVHSQSIFDEVGGNAFDGSYGSVAGSPISQAQRDYTDLFRQETGGESDNPYPGFAFDAAAIIALAIEHADSEDSADIRDSLRAVANPPGTSVGPKDLARALQIIRDGQDVNYVGAGGDQDFDEQGDVVNTIQLWRINGNQIEDLDIYLKPGDPVELPSGLTQSDSTGDQRATVTIGSVMPSTGDLGVFGPDMIAAVDIVESEVNAAGGLNGKELQILHRDSATNEQVATDAANALVNVDGAVAIIGGMSSGITLSIAQSVAIPNGIPQISPASSSPAITFLEDNDFVFRTNVSDALQGGIIADVATKLGFDRIATTYINNAYGEGLSRVFTDGFEGNGGTITGQVGHESGQVSYLAELRQAAQDDAEALIVIAYPETASVLLRESVEGGFFENYIFVDGVHSQSIFDEVGGNVFDGSYGSVAGSPISQAQRDYTDLFRQETGGESDNPYPGFAFDAAAIVALAIEHADSENPADIRNSLREVANPPGTSVGPKDLARALQLIRDGQDVNYVGAGGDQDFDAQGDVINTIQLWRINGNQIEDLDIYLKPGDPVELPDDTPTGMMQSGADNTDAATRFQIGEGSEAIFKVDETLRGVDVVVAMQTNALSGQIDLGASSASIDIDLHSLTSDQARRDRYVRERMFPQYPITSVSFPGLGSVPSDFTTSGQEFTTVLPATVTVNGQTAELDFNITARVDNGTDLVVLGTANFVWSDFGMTAPVSSFFTVEDDVRVEILLRAKHR